MIDDDVDYEDDGPECEHRNAIELVDYGTGSTMWCADCESEFDDPN